MTVRKIATLNISSPMERTRYEEGKRVVEAEFGPVKWLASENLYAVDGFLAGNDDLRLSSLENAFSSDAEIVWFAKGGYGASRLLPRIDMAKFASTKKKVIGYSDVTAFLLPYAEAGGPAFHGPMIAADLKNRYPRTLDSLRNLVFDGSVDRFLFTPRWYGGETDRLEGKLLAGNLEIIASLVGTPWLPPSVGAIVCIEEIDEQPYRIDRTLNQLLLAGFFECAAGMVVGSMTDCEPVKPHLSLTVDQVFEDFSRRSGLPCVGGFPFGHGGENTVLPQKGTLVLSREGDQMRAEIRA